MLEKEINWEYLNSLNTINEKLENVFTNTEVIAKGETDKEIGVIHRVIKNDKILMLLSDDKNDNNENIEKIIKTVYEFNTLTDAMNYLREVRFDHAVNYEMKNLIPPLLSSLYKNKKLVISDILGV